MSKKVDLSEEADQQGADQKEASSEQSDLQEAVQELSDQAEQLSRRVEEVEEQRDEFRELLQRKQAEFDNYRKRTLRERDEIGNASRADVLKELLPVLDACEKGLEALPNPDGDPLLEGYLKGYQLLVGEIRAVFGRFGVEAVPGLGQPFDPNFHEAVMREETAEHEDGSVLEEFRKGYRYQDRLLRPSQVKVAVQPERDAEGEGTDPPEPAGSATEPDGKVDIQA